MIEYPLSPSTWQNLLPAASFRFVLMEADQIISRTLGGDVIRDEIGTTYWKILVSFGKLTAEELSPAEALVDTVKAQPATVLVTPPQNAAPASDPTGAILGAAEPRVNFVDRNARTISIIDLPVGYELRRGDFCTIRYDNRRSLHRVVQPVAFADGAGSISNLSIEPNIPRGFSPLGALDLLKPQALAVYSPGSFSEGSYSKRVSNGVSFELQTSLRPINA